MDMDKDKGLIFNGRERRAYRDGKVVSVNPAKSAWKGNVDKVGGSQAHIKAEDVEVIVYDKDNELDIKPIYGYIFITMNIVRNDSPILRIGQENIIETEQHVLSVSDDCKFVKPGDVIGIEMKDFLRGKQVTDSNDRNNITQTMEVNLPVFSYKGKDYLKIAERNILYIKR